MRLSQGFSALLLSIGGTASVDAFTASSQQLQLIYRSGSTISSATLRATKSSETIPDLSSSTKPVDESNIFDNSDDEDASWQKNVDMLLAPDTSVAQRQIVLSDLLSSGDKIQESVRTALRERKVSFIPWQCMMWSYSCIVAELDIKYANF